MRGRNVRRPLSPSPQPSPLKGEGVSDQKFLLQCTRPIMKLSCRRFLGLLIILVLTAHWAHAQSSPAAKSQNNFQQERNTRNKIRETNRKVDEQIKKSKADMARARQRERDNARLLRSKLKR